MKSNIPTKALKLKLELELPFSKKSNEFKILRALGKVRNGIVREVVVPATMTLHALNYLICKCFGWQNSHLHHFEYPESTFQMLTNGTYLPDNNGRIPKNGLYSRWCELCGIYFRYPSEDFTDWYWDDDYQEGEDFYTWLEKKYCGPYRYEGKQEHYLFANKQALSLLEKNPSFTKLSMKHEHPEKVLHVNEATIEDIHFYLLGSLDELLERLSLCELITTEDKLHSTNAYKETIEDLIEDMETTIIDPRVIPLNNKLIYKYDYGDGWVVNITCEATYEEYYSRHSGELIDVIHGERPLCTYVDGYNVMDDVGGVYGYIDFLLDYFGGNSEERKEAKGYGSFMGWINRLPKADEIL